MFLDSVLFVNAMTFISVNSVIPYFLTSLGASTFHISLSSALVGIGTFISQPLFSIMAVRLQYKLKTFIQLIFIQRILFLVFVLCIPVVASRNPGILIWLFLIFWGVFNFFVGSYSPFYYSIFSKFIPQNQRGRLIGFAGGLGNMLAVGSSILIGIILNRIIFPYNYMAIFVIGTVILFMDVLDYRLMKNEPADKLIENETVDLKYLRKSPQLICKNRKFFNIIMGCIFFIISNIGLAYYSLYAIRNFSAGGAEIAIFTGISVVANTIAFFIFGIIADKYGHKYVLQYSALCGFCGGIIMLILPTMISAYVAFALSTISVCGYQLSSGMIIIHEAPKEQISVYVSTNVMITLFISSILTLLSGIIIDKISFVPIFIMTAVGGIGAYIIFKNIDRYNS